MSLTAERILQGLAATGSKLGAGSVVEILIVGGAAVLLTGLGTPDRNTSDVDVLAVDPSRSDDELGAAAEAVGRELGFPMDWLNRDVGLFRVALPDGWKSRRRAVGRYGRLHAYAASRQDLISMKLFGGREKDLEDLTSIAPTDAELSFARRHFEVARADWPAESNKIDNVIFLIDGWRG